MKYYHAFFLNYRTRKALEWNIDNCGIRWHSMKTKSPDMTSHHAIYVVPRCVVTIKHKGRCTLSVKLSDFTVWRHTWRKNWLNCAVLTGNSAGLWTVLSSRLSYTELRSSFRESHCCLSLHVFNHHSHTYKKTHITAKKKKLANLMGNLCCAREH
jgi:hypothetical protein